MKCGLQVDSDTVVPLLLGELIKRNRRAGAVHLNHPSIVHEDVNAAVVPQDFLQECSVCSRLVRSATFAKTSAPLSASSLARSSILLVVEVIATRAPCWANSRAVAQAIPSGLPAPGT